MGGERMKKVCLTVLCILLVGCGNAETAETEEKMRFENLDPAKVNMQYGGLKEWDRFYNSFYEQKEGSDLIVLGTVEDYSCFAGGIEIATNISLRVDDVLKGEVIWKPENILRFESRAEQLRWKSICSPWRMRELRTGTQRS